MATANQERATTNDVEAQVKQIKEDLSTLTRLLVQVAGHETEHTKDLALAQAADMIDRSKATAVAARQRVEGAAHSLEHYIEEKPVQSAMIALVAGMFIGWLSRR
jgi:ElaB/YqjD/DUF883 family membrane-anchored ribosome-binding protein